MDARQRARQGLFPQPQRHAPRICRKQCRNKRLRNILLILRKRIHTDDKRRHAAAWRLRRHLPRTGNKARRHRHCRHPLRPLPTHVLRQREALDKTREGRRTPHTCKVRCSSQHVQRSAHDGSFPQQLHPIPPPAHQGQVRQRAAERGRILRKPLREVHVRR